MTQIFHRRAFSGSLLVSKDHSASSSPACGWYPHVCPLALKVPCQLLSVSWMEVLSLHPQCLNIHIKTLSWNVKCCQRQLKTHLGILHFVSWQKWVYGFTCVQRPDKIPLFWGLLLSWYQLKSCYDQHHWTQWYWGCSACATDSFVCMSSFSWIIEQRESWKNTQVVLILNPSCVNASKSPKGCQANWWLSPNTIPGLKPQK